MITQNIITEDSEYQPKKRGRKPKSETLSLEEQIEETTLELERITNKLNDLKKKQEEEKKQILLKALTESDKSYNEILDFLKHPLVLNK